MIKFLSSLITLTILVIGVSVGSFAHAVSNKIVVIVDNDVITESELDAKKRLIRVDKSNPLNEKLDLAITDEETQSVLIDALIADKVQSQYASQINLSPSSGSLEKEIAKLASSNRLTVDQFKQAILSSGVDWGLFLNEIETDLIAKRLIQRVVAPTVSVSDVEINNFIRVNSLDSRSGSYNFEHVLVKLSDKTGAKVNAEEEDSLREKIEVLKTKPLTLAEFKVLATELANQNQQIEYKSVGERKANQLPDLFVAELELINAGQSSAVMHSGNALHLLYLVDKAVAEAKGQEKRKLAHILLKATTKEERSVAELRLNQLRQKLIANEESFSKLASTISDDANSAALGGDLGWVKRGDTVPTFEETAYSLKEVGMVSLPVQTQFGVHLIKLLEVSVQDRSESVREFAKSQLLLQKASQQYPAWLEDLVNKAYVQRIN